MSDLEAMLGEDDELGLFGPELGKIKLGRVFKAAATGGLSEVAKAGKKLVKKVTGKAKASGQAAVSAAIGSKKKAPKSSAAKSSPAVREAPLARAAAPASGPTVRIVVEPIREKPSALKIGPELKETLRILKQMQLQSQATSEHNALRKRSAFRKKVLRQLKQIKAHYGA